MGGGRCTPPLWYFVFCLSAPLWQQRNGHFGNISPTLGIKSVPIKPIRRNPDSGLHVLQLSNFMDKNLHLQPRYIWLFNWRKLVIRTCINWVRLHSSLKKHTLVHSYQHKVISKWGKAASFYMCCPQRFKPLLCFYIFIYWSCK